MILMSVKILFCNITDCNCDRYSQNCISKQLCPHQIRARQATKQKKLVFDKVFEKAANPRGPESQGHPPGNHVGYLVICSHCRLQDSSVFGCKLEQQKLVSGQAVKVPELVWRCVEKIEAEPANLSTEGIYRVPGDAAKIQKLRIDLDQVKRCSLDVR